MEKNMLTWEIRATGRVQGVGYRRFVQICARRCQITGWVSNQYDGSVLIAATGEQDGLELFCELLRAKRGFIDVRQLEFRKQSETVEYDEFTIR